MDPPLIDLDEDVSTIYESPPIPPPPPPAARVTDRYFHSASSSDEEDGEALDDVVTSKSIESTSKRLDYMLQFLDRKLSNDASSPQNDRSSLPEFVASGGGTGIFKVPRRFTVRPDRPPCLELRPHPLRESQIGRFLRTITATDSQLWAGGECGVRVWDFKDLYEPGIGDVKSGDEYTAPFRESASTSPTLCLVRDEGCRVVWSGHRDGRIRCWKMTMPDANGELRSHFMEDFSWQAHRGPVLSLVTTYNGMSLLCSSYFRTRQFDPYKR